MQSCSERCMDVTNNYLLSGACYRQLYRLVHVLFTPVQLCAFFEKCWYALFHIFSFAP